MITVYGDEKSGNCYKVKLTLALLGLHKNEHYSWQDVDLMQGETRSDSFLAKNPLGQIPMIELLDGRILTQSNAIIGYLARDTALIPTEEFDKALMYQWLFFEQYSHEPCIAVARFIQLYQNMPSSRQAEYDALQQKGDEVLTLLDNQLADYPFIIGQQFTLADIALYAYTHVAHEGGFDLSYYPNIARWLANVEQQSGFVGMFE